MLIGLNTFEIGLLEVVLVAFWNGYYRRYLVVLILISLVLLRLSFQQWKLSEKITVLNSFQNKRIWIEGTINHTSIQNDEKLLEFSDIQFKNLQMTYDKIFVKFVDSRKRNFYRGRRILISGNIEQVNHKVREIYLVLSNIRTWSMHPEQARWEYFLESLRSRLANRAKFYLSDNSIQLYLPLVLGLKSYGQTYSLFRDLGLSHLLVVSGLHAGFFFFGIRFIVIFLTKRIPYLLTSRYRKIIQDGISFATLFLYLILLGFPTPALRATFGIGLFLMTKYAGIVVNPLHALATVAAVFLLWNPQWISDLSFQFSFIATAGLIVFVPLYISGQDSHFLRRLFIYLVNSVLASIGALLALAPVLLHVFTNISIAPLFLNTFMTPLLAFLVLPICILALIVSIFCLNAVPMGWVEVKIFTLADWVLKVWSGVLELMGSGKPYTLVVKYEWQLWHYFLYYVFFLLLMWIFKRLTVYKRISPNLRETCMIDR